MLVIRPLQQDYNVSDFSQWIFLKGFCITYVKMNKVNSVFSNELYLFVCLSFCLRIAFHLYFSPISISMNSFHRFILFLSAILFFSLFLPSTTFLSIFFHLSFSYISLFINFIASFLVSSLCFLFLLLRSLFS